MPQNVVLSRSENTEARLLHNFLVQDIAETVSRVTQVYKFFIKLFTAGILIEILNKKLADPSRHIIFSLP